jgi:hypothetical protein
MQTPPFFWQSRFQGTGAQEISSASQIRFIASSDSMKALADLNRTRPMEIWLLVPNLFLNQESNPSRKEYCVRPLRKNVIKTSLRRAEGRGIERYKPGFLSAKALVEWVINPRQTEESPFGSPFVSLLSYKFPLY